MKIGWKIIALFATLACQCLVANRIVVRWEEPTYFLIIYWALLTVLFVFLRFLKAKQSLKIVMLCLTVGFLFGIIAHQSAWLISREGGFDTLFHDATSQTLFFIKANLLIGVMVLGWLPAGVMALVGLDSERSPRRSQ